MKNIQVITTDDSRQLYWEESVRQADNTGDCMHIINVWPELIEQTIEGFGGAFTEASVHNYGKLSAADREAVLEGYYGSTGLRYTMGRVHMNSCDFALGNYTYVEEGDTTLSTFDIAHDKEHMIPMIKEAVKTAGEPLVFLASPWSPPAYMKSNGEMNHGGRLKEEYYSLWAEYYVKYLNAYAGEGIRIRYLTIQNEPAATQTWDSCIYEAEEEGIFVRDYLAPALKKAGLTDIGIFVWDHNKEEMYRRASDTFAVEGSREEIAGIAVHWYTGDHFDAIRAVKKAFPEKKIFFTEGCVEYSRFGDSGEVQKAEMYAHDILGDFSAGIDAFLDWNLLLDEKGGPNHVGNFCAAPMMLAADGGVEKRLSYYYIGHFSRYIDKGAVRVLNSTYTTDIETVSFLNPDGSRVVVLLNRTGEEKTAVLREAGTSASLKLAGHSIMTVKYDPS